MSSAFFISSWVCISSWNSSVEFFSDVELDVVKSMIDFELAEDCCLQCSTRDSSALDLLDLVSDNDAMEFFIVVTKCEMLFFDSKKLDSND